MNRHYAAFEAENGPLFEKPKRIDRLNLEDTTLLTYKWTTKVCSGEVEALPIIVEKEENAAPEGESVPVPVVPKETENADEVSDVTSENAPRTDVDETETSSPNSSNSNDDFSCIFTNRVSSLHSVRETEFETISGNAFPLNTPRTNRRAPSENSDSSSDEEMDRYFQFEITLPKRFGIFSDNLQSSEGRTELMASDDASETTSQDVTTVSQLNSDFLASSPSEICLGTMEADFSDANSEDNEFSLTRRIVQPLSLRYSSEEMNEGSGRLLCHTTSLMNFRNQPSFTEDQPDDGKDGEVDGEKVEKALLE